MFAEAYVGVMQHFRGGGWYHDADIFTGQPTHIQFQSLQSFWPGEPLCRKTICSPAGSSSSGRPGKAGRPGPCMGGQWCE